VSASFVPFNVNARSLDLTGLSVRGERPRAVSSPPPWINQMSADTAPVLLETDAAGRAGANADGANASHRATSFTCGVGCTDAQGPSQTRSIPEDSPRTRPILRQHLPIGDGEKPEMTRGKTPAEAEIKSDDIPWLSPVAEKDRIKRLSLEGTEVTTFMLSSEFISLGCYYPVSRSLQALGLKEYAYPFDWNRSPAKGIVHLLEMGFQDFLSYNFTRETGPRGRGRCFGDSRWGGSFWHHDITKPKVKADFARRVDRFLGNGEVPTTTPRVFVRAVNSTYELHATLRLRRALQRAFPETKIYILLLVDLQSTSGLVRLAGGAHDLLFFRVHEDVQMTAGKPWTLERQCEAYAEGIAAAVRYWAGSKQQPHVEEANGLQQLIMMCDPFDGGNTSTDLFCPRRLNDHLGQTLSASGHVPEASAQLSSRSEVNLNQMGVAQALQAPKAETSAPDAAESVQGVKNSASDCDSPATSHETMLSTSRESRTQPRPATAPEQATRRCRPHRGAAVQLVQASTGQCEERGAGKLRRRCLPCAATK